MEATEIKNKLSILERAFANDYFIVSDDLKILSIDDSLSRLLFREGADNLLLTPDLLSEDQTSQLLEEGSLTLLREGRVYELLSFPSEEYLLIKVTDKSHESRLARELETARDINSEWRNLFDKYGGDTVWITDARGNTLVVDEKIAMNLGVPKEDFVGRNIIDLEREGFFNPSVGRLVLNSRKIEVALQQTRNGKLFLCVGTPVFHRNGSLSKIVIISKDYSSHISLSEFIADSGCESIAMDELDPVAEDFITANSAMLDCLRLIKLAAKIDVTVLLSGETGVGKSRLARIIHNLSGRAGKPFIEINCGSISPSLIESELFGYESGAFTGASKEGKPGLIEAARGGTVFLDEISELGLSQQVKLLEIMQDRQLTRIGSTRKTKVDVRFIVASNKNLEELVDLGYFRKDLFYRINVMPVHIPPLRQRQSDIPLLTDYFIKQNNKKYKNEKTVTPPAMNALLHYSWPGNIRELEHVIERAHIIAPGRFIGIEDLPSGISGSGRPEKEDGMVVVNKLGSLQDVVEQAEKELISLAMEKYPTSREIAEALGSNPSTISRRMEKYGLKRKGQKDKI
ncbi:MAG TPA: sigma 54-interacting transcriptional regulator [Candidatus Copromorpha excrementigallinarum]|uniref:HTH-type transcriptional regulatory protein TyrR n=1 Tax=Candidatus Allocopromorpha excrementigallinarum TaxID=2840742 RepID=A0A9D1I3U5_9FIRM|nr:sigma 54-interacting transcriptional regulator [Candidatus Copromorpha excrementigallinarum]